MSENQPIVFTIPQGIDALRVDKAIALETNMARSVIKKLFEDKMVLVNGENTKRSEKVSPGDEIEVMIVDSIDEEIQAQEMPIEVVFEDEYLAVINKQAYVVVHPGAGNPDHTLVNGLLYRYPQIRDVGQSYRPGIVHRLDATTSGLLVIAKTQEAYERFVEMFSTHDVNREYIALVWGKFDTTSGVIQGAIGRSIRPTKMALRHDGKRAITHYKVKEYFEEKNVSLIDVALETGRTHQIRVHCSSIGHPIVGDKTYGGFRQSIDCPRPFLHAHTLKFNHPITNESLEFSTALPLDLQGVQDGLSDV